MDNIWKKSLAAFGEKDQEVHQAAACMAEARKLLFTLLHKAPAPDQRILEGLEELALAFTCIEDDSDFKALGQW